MWNMIKFHHVRSETTNTFTNMKKYFTIYRNWRVLVLCAIAMFAAIFIFGDTEDIGYLLLTKVIGFVLAYLCYRLGKYWNSKGKISELMELANEE